MSSENLASNVAENFFKQNAPEKKLDADNFD